MVEDVRCSMDEAQLDRPVKGESPMDVLPVFSSWEEAPVVQSLSSGT